MSKILTLLVLHCLATPEGRNQTSDDIRRMHLSPVSEGGRGWKQVGYADMFHLDGRTENLVPYDEDNLVEPWEITNGATGINSISRHVVYVGGMSKDMKKPKDTRTPFQVHAMTEYVLDMIRKHPHIQIAGHNQFANKACPSFDVPKWLESIGVPAVNICRHVFKA